MNDEKKERKHKIITSVIIVIVQTYRLECTLHGEST